MRAKLSMSALNPRRYHPAIGASYASLVARGKTFKRAMTACLRESLMLMNVLVARGPARNPSYAT